MPQHWNVFTLKPLKIILWGIFACFGNSSNLEILRFPKNVFLRFPHHFIQLFCCIKVIYKDQIETKKILYWSRGFFHFYIFGGIFSACVISVVAFLYIHHANEMMHYIKGHPNVYENIQSSSAIPCNLC